MTEMFTLTQAKARLSEIINSLIYKKGIVMITKKGKNVAVILPVESYQKLEKRQGRGLIEAAGALAEFDEEIDKMVEEIYKAREREKSRKVAF